MSKKLVLAVLFLLVTAQSFAAGNLTGVYVTNQQNLTGSMKVQQIDESKFKFEIYTEKHGSGSYAGSVTTCSVDGVANVIGADSAYYIKQTDSGDLVLIFNISKNKINVSSNADEKGMCGMNAWLDGAYKKNTKKQ